jgi:hypothetical protein
VPAALNEGDFLKRFLDAIPSKAAGAGCDASSICGKTEGRVDITSLPDFE